MGWREEITTALETWLGLEGGPGRSVSWACVGRAVRTGESGAFTVDVRGNDTAADQVESLRLAGPEEPAGDEGYAVLEAAQSGSALTVRVAQFAEPPDPHLWMLKQPPTSSSRLCAIGSALSRTLRSPPSSPRGVLAALRPR